jgi:hypothetical protein
MFCFLVNKNQQRQNIRPRLFLRDHSQVNWAGRAVAGVGTPTRNYAELKLLLNLRNVRGSQVWMLSIIFYFAIAAWHW